MVLSVGATEKIPSDTTGDRSRDSPTSSAVVYVFTFREVTCPNCSEDRSYPGLDSQFFRPFFPAYPKRRSFCHIR